MELFDHLNNLTVLKKEADFSNDEIRKSYDRYIINRFISMIELYIPVVAEINKYDVPEQTHYQYYFSVLPHRKCFFNYIKKVKDLNKEEKKYIARYFECGIREVNQYVNILSIDEINEILNIYKYGKNKTVEV
jgi:hypothetical protein